jgi:hypothetical protein
MAGFGTGLAEGINAGGNLAQIVLNKREMALRERQSNAEYGPGGLAQQRMDIAKQNVDVAKQNAGVAARNAETAAGQLGLAQQTPQAQWDKSLQHDAVASAGALTRITKAVPETQVVLGPLLNKFDTGGKMPTRGDVYSYLLQMQTNPQFSEMRTKIREKAAALQSQGKTGEAAKYLSVYQETSPQHYEDMVDNLMGKPMSIRRSAAQRGKPEAPPTQYGKPQWDARTQSWIQYDQNGKAIKVAQAPSSSKGMRLYDAQGNLIFEQGGGLGAPTSKAQSDLQTKIAAGQDQLARLEKIKSEYDPRFTTIAAKASASMMNLGEKLGHQLLPADKAELAKYSKFAQDTTDNVNTYIHNMTGAVMNKYEAKRLMVVQPNIGTNWLNGDGATRFKSKLDNVIENTKAAIRRSQMLLVEGFTPQDVAKQMSAGRIDQSLPLSSFTETGIAGNKRLQDAMDKAGDQLAATLQQQGVPADQIQGLVLKRLSIRFGLNIGQGQGQGQGQ